MALSTFPATKRGLSENCRFFLNFYPCKLLLLVWLTDKCPYSARSPPFTRTMIKISQKTFYTRSPKESSCEIISKIGPAVSEKDFLRISSCPFSARSPHSTEPCLWMDYNFANNFRKGSPKEQSYAIISKSDSLFRRTFFKNFFMSL